METENPISNGSIVEQQQIQQHNDGENVTKKIRKRQCRVCRKKFKNFDSYTSHIKLHKVTRKLSNVHNKKIRHKYRHTLNTSKTKQTLLFECRICGTKHQGFSDCFEHQRLHEEHSKFFTDLFTSSDHQVTTEDNAFHILNNGSEQPTEVIIATSEDVDVELLESETIIHNGHHGVDNSSLQAARERFTKVLNKEAVESTTHTDVINLAGFVGSKHESDNVSTHLSVPFTTPDISLMETLCTAASTQTPSFIPSTHISTTSPSASCKLVDSNDGMHIEIPSQVKAIYLNNSTPDLSDVLQKLDELNNKVDSIIRYLNDPATPVPLNPTTIQVHPDERKLVSEDDGESVILEGFPPSYSIIQAAKEQQQQQYYASSIANRQVQLFKTNEPHNSPVSTTDVKGFVKKPVDIWVPTQQYLSAMSTLGGHDEEEEEEKTKNDHTSTGLSNIIRKDIIDKVFVESRSRANFAKNLCFAIFPFEERQGRNCTGRVFGKAQHKGQLDPVKLQAVKEVTFRRYPCSSTLADMTWRKECVTAIDSGLRNENRTTKTQTVLYDNKFHHVSDSGVIKVDDNGHDS